MIIFTILADFITYSLLNLPVDARWSEALHFFIEDTSKIFVLLFVMIYLIALLRAGVDTDRIRLYLQGKNRGIAYVLAAAFGAVTPFCSCSSIPLFLGFTSARIPLGITMAFLITSPMINEVAVILLGSILGVEFMILYILTGLTAGILGGFFIDSIKAERHLTDLGQQASSMTSQCCTSQEDETNIKLSLKDRHNFAKDEVQEITGRIWKWIFIGVGLGAFLHGFIPSEWITENLGKENWWAVPAAVMLGIPLYSSASAVIPVAETLLVKGLPVGTTLAFMMSTVAASFPEFMMLKQVMKPKLLLIFFLMLLFFFTAAGWIFNFVY